jgi:hypothetical protein
VFSVSFGRGVLFCVMYVVRVLCLIVVPLPQGKNPFAVKINNNEIKFVAIIKHVGVWKHTYPLSSAVKLS